MTSALIAEDELLLAEALRCELVSLWPDLQMLPLQADGHSALEAALALRPDLCFLDIRMPALSGLEVAAALAEDWPQTHPFPLLVFVTAYDAYAVRAFEAQAADYLLKPVSSDRLATCVQRLKVRMAERQSRSDTMAQALQQLRGLMSRSAPEPAHARLEIIPAQVGTMVHFVPIEEVLYFEAADKYVRVVTADRDLLIKTSLRELLPQLDPQRFWQVHRGTVVQARAVLRAQREESGRVLLTLAGRPETLVGSRLYAHRFKGM